MERGQQCSADVDLRWGVGVSSLLCCCCYCLSKNDVVQGK